MILIQANHLYRYFAKHCAVKNVSFSLEKGEVLGFLGPNGAGKTTTMQLLCGLLAPHSGEIVINGIDLMEYPKLAKRSLGFLPDQPPLYKDLTVREFLNYCARLHQLEPRLANKAILGAMGRCGLTNVSQRIIANLSKGYQQRVGIAQAILHNPEIIILDEPTVGLDPIQIKEIRELIKELGQDHGIILSTHILPEIQQICSHVQIIHRGQLVLKETIQELNQRMTTDCLHIHTLHDIDLARLPQLHGVISLQQISAKQLTVHYTAGINPAAQLAEAIIGCGWGLLEMIPEKTTMEEIFLQLTTQEQSNT